MTEAQLIHEAWKAWDAALLTLELQAVEDYLQQHVSAYVLRVPKRFSPVERQRERLN